MPISLKQLRYFLVLSEELHFGKAAKRLHISQPPLSVSMKQLEGDLGVQLLNRDSNGTRLTPAGVILAERATKILGQLEETKIVLTNAGEVTERKVTVGFLSSMIFRNFSKMLSSFSAEFPSVNIAIEELFSPNQIAGIENHEIDVGFIHAMPLPEGINYLTLKRERFICCLPRGHRLVTRSRISLRELSGERVLIFPRSHAFGYYDHISSLLKRADIEPYSDYRLKNWFTILVLIGQGMGISIMPQAIARSNISTSDVVFVELQEEDAYHELLLIWRDNELEASSNHIASFVTHAKRYYLGFSQFHKS